MADRAAPMSSEEARRDRTRRHDPEFWFMAYAGEYLSSAAEEAEAREDFDAMIQQIEQRVLAQQPCYSDIECCRTNGCEDHACPTCTARQMQETSGSQQYEAHDHGALRHEHFTQGAHDHP